MVSIARGHIAHDWIFLLLLTLVILFALFKNAYLARFQRFFAFGNSAQYLRHYGYKKYEARHFFQMVIGQSPLFGLVLFTLFKRIHPIEIQGFSDSGLFLFTTVCLLLSQLLHAVLHLFLSSLFNLKSFGAVYLHNKYRLLFLSGIPFIPLLFLIYYSPIPYRILLDGLIAYTLFYLGFWQVLITVEHWKYGKGHFALLFLYLCTLEALPLLGGAKFLFS